VKNSRWARCARRRRSQHELRIDANNTGGESPMGEACTGFASVARLRICANQTTKQIFQRGIFGAEFL